MKIFKTLVFLPILAALLSFTATASFANDCSLVKLPPVYQATLKQTTLRHTAGMKESAGFAILSGTLVSLNRENQEITVKTAVPGFLGPEEREFPLKIDNDTTMTICFKSRNQCNSATAGHYGWATFTSMEKLSNFSKAKKNVTVVTDVDTSRVVHIQIEYEL